MPSDATFYGKECECYSTDPQSAGCFDLGELMKDNLVSGSYLLPVCCIKPYEQSFLLAANSLATQSSQPKVQMIQHGTQKVMVHFEDYGNTHKGLKKELPSRALRSRLKLTHASDKLYTNTPCIFMPFSPTVAASSLFLFPTLYSQPRRLCLCRRLRS